METKILFKTKGKLQNTQNFISETQEELNQYLLKGYKIVSSNMTTEGAYMYLYFLLEK